MSLLKFGAKGDAVVSIQKQLKNFGFKGENGKVLSTDGIFGEGTEYAVLQFQKSVGILADGKVGDKTRAALAGQIVKKAEAYNTIQSSYPTAAELIGNYDKGTTTASTKTHEAKLEDATAVISLTAAATGTTYSTTLSDGNKKVAVFGCAAGLNVYYYDYTPSTAAMQTVKAGAGC